MDPRHCARSRERRASRDLLLVEADAGRQRILRLRVAELKAGTTRAGLSAAALDSLAEQAVVVTARLRACFDTPTTAEARAAREALRRLLWMGAGAQLEALAWQAALSDFDEALRRGSPPRTIDGVLDRSRTRLGWRASLSAQCPGARSLRRAHGRRDDGALPHPGADTRRAGGTAYCAGTADITACPRAARPRALRQSARRPWGPRL